MINTDITREFFFIMTNLDTYKVGALNVSALILSFTHIEGILKIGLLAASIVYTIYKTIEIIDRRKANKLKQQKEDNENIN